MFQLGQYEVQITVDEIRYASIIKYIRTHIPHVIVGFLHDRLVLERIGTYWNGCFIRCFRSVRIFDGDTLLLALSNTFTLIDRSIFRCGNRCGLEWTWTWYKWLARCGASITASWLSRLNALWRHKHKIVLRSTHLSEEILGCLRTQTRQTYAIWRCNTSRCGTSFILWNHAVREKRERDIETTNELIAIVVVDIELTQVLTSVLTQLYRLDLWCWYSLSLEKCRSNEHSKWKLLNTPPPPLNVTKHRRQNLPGR